VLLCIHVDIATRDPTDVVSWSLC